LFIPIDYNKNKPHFQHNRRFKADKLKGLIS
jgi:hypothetical protein